MKIFIDTADVEAIRKAKEMGFISGVTTNPSLIAAEGKDFHTVIKEIASIVDGPVSAEVLSETAEEMIAEGQVLAGLDPHVVVKIPMTGEGMKAVSALSDMGIRSNVTLIFSAGQALLAARAGASYVSPFVGRCRTDPDDCRYIPSPQDQNGDHCGLCPQAAACGTMCPGGGRYCHCSVPGAYGHS